MSDEATALRPIDPLAHRALEALVRAESSLTRRLAADLDRIGVSATGFAMLVLLTSAGGRLELPLAPDLAGAVTRATLLEDQGADLSLIRHAGGLTVQGPQSAPDPVVTVLALDVPGSFQRS